MKYDPHAKPHDKQRSAPVYYTALFMELLLAGVFSFFGLHVALWFPREIRLRRQRAAEEKAAESKAPVAEEKAEEKKDGDEPR